MAYTLNVSKSLYNKSIDAAIAQADVGIARSANSKSAPIIAWVAHIFLTLLAQDVCGATNKPALSVN